MFASVSSLLIASAVAFTVLLFGVTLLALMLAHEKRHAVMSAAELAWRAEYRTAAARRGRPPVRPVRSAARPARSTPLGTARVPSRDARMHRLLAEMAALVPQDGATYYTWHETAYAPSGGPSGAVRRTDRVSSLRSASSRRARHRAPTQPLAVTPLPVRWPTPAKRSNRHEQPESRTARR